MALSFHEFWLPRRGSSAEEYEDAFASNAAAGRFALADGATESSYSALWAQLLVNDFVQNDECDPDRWMPRLLALQKQWYESVRGPSLSWNVEAKLEQGAFATFLGIAIAYSERIPQWEVMGVGDACFFHTRGPILFSAFPLDCSSQFNNVPHLLGSRMSPESLRKIPALRIQGSGLINDRLWMMTDALAQWCLLKHEAGNEPWEQMNSFLNKTEGDRHFSDWIEELRTSRQLRNDDVTLVAIDL